MEVGCTDATDSRKEDRERVEQQHAFGGRYRIVAVLGEGGMGRVYLATDERLHRRVAVKALHPYYNDQPPFVARFVQEARLAAALSHPHIVGVHDSGRDDDGAHFIVMAYVAGEDLGRLLARHGPLSFATTLALGAQIAQALDYAHSHGVIHRDIKPANILLTDGRQVTVGDFGIARALDSPGVTTIGTMLGSAAYIAPEQAQGADATAQTDLYALGIVMYEMLTGRTPFAADHEPALTVALRQVNDAPPPPSTFNPAISSAIDTAVLTALAKDPERRYQSGAALIAALRTAGGSGGAFGDTTTITPSLAAGPTTPEGHAVGRDMGAAHDAGHVAPTSGAATTTIGAAALHARARGGGSGGGHGRDATRGAAPVPPSPRHRLLIPLVLAVLLLAAALGIVLTQTGRPVAGPPSVRETATPPAAHRRVVVLASFTTTPTVMATATALATPTPTSTAMATALATPTPTPMATPTSTPMATATGLPPSATASATRPTLTGTPEATTTGTSTAVPTETMTSPTATAIAQPRVTITVVPTETAPPVAPIASSTPQATSGYSGSGGTATSQVQAAVAYANNVYYDVMNNRDASQVATAFGQQLAQANRFEAHTLLRQHRHWRMSLVGPLRYGPVTRLGPATASVTVTKQESALEYTDAGAQVADKSGTVTLVDTLQRVDGRWLVVAVN